MSWPSSAVTNRPGMISVTSYPTPQAAADACRSTGEALIFPAGEFLIQEPLRLTSGTLVIGEGRATVLKRHGNKANPLIMVDGGEDIKITGLTFDLNCTGPNYLTGVQFRGLSARCEVASCWFMAGGDPTSRQTQHGILANNCAGLSVHDCRFYQVQLKASSQGDAGPCIIRGNQFHRPFNFAISFVGQKADDTQDSLIIADNVITDLPSSGGIFVGGDGENAEGWLSDVLVHHNIITGEWGPGAFAGIHVLCPTRAYRIGITDNIVNNFAGPNTSPSPNSMGISVKARNGGSWIDDVTITGNHVRGTDYYGIRVHAGAPSTMRAVLIADNTCADTRGIQVYGPAHTNPVLRDNILLDRGKEEVLTWE